MRGKLQDAPRMSSRRGAAAGPEERARDGTAVAAWDLRSRSCGSVPGTAPPFASPPAGLFLPTFGFPCASQGQLREGLPKASSCWGVGFRSPTRCIAIQEVPPNPPVATTDEARGGVGGNLAGASRLIKSHASPTVRRPVASGIAPRHADHVPSLSNRTL